MAAKVACDSLHQYLRRHSSCDLAITHSGDPLSFSICQLSAWDSRENYRRFLENYKGQQKGAFDLFLFSLCKAFQVPAVCQLPDFLLPGWLHSFIIFHFNSFSFSHVSPFHTVPLLTMSFAFSNPFHKNGRATKHPLPFWCRDWVLFRHINEYWSLSSLTSFPFSSCSPFTKAPSRWSEAVNGCALGKPTINNCG